jgi:predicted transcriptional regulator
MKVERVCTRQVVAVSRFDSVEEAAATMRRFHVGALLVTEKTEARTEVVGIVTDRDLVMHALAEGLDARRVAVEKVMSPVVASVPESGDLLDALERMRAAGVRRLLVTTEKGDPSGLVSLDDVVDGLAAELASAAALLKAEVRREQAELGAPQRTRP